MVGALIRRDPVAAQRALDEHIDYLAGICKVTLRHGDA
jgi:hypothetical protein